MVWSPSSASGSLPILQQDDHFADCGREGNDHHACFRLQWLQAFRLLGLSITPPVLLVTLAF